MANYTNFSTIGQSNPINTINPVAPLGGMNIQPNLTMPQFFLPQPIGSVYTLNTSSEIANIPAGTAMSVGLCLNENTLYIKTLQNNNPVLVAYRLSPMEQLVEPASSSSLVPAQNQTQQTTPDILSKVNERLERIENRLFKTENENKGGKLDWQV